MRFESLILLLVPVSGLAQQSADATRAIEPLSSPYLLQLTGGLILVVLVIFLLAWILKRLNFTQQSQAGLIRVIAGMSLGTRDRIVLVQVGEEQILLGLLPGRIAKLHSLEVPILVDPKPDSSPAFAQKLNRLMGKKAEK